LSLTWTNISYVSVGGVETIRCLSLEKSDILLGSLTYMSRSLDSWGVRQCLIGLKQTSNVTRLIVMIPNFNHPFSCFFSHCFRCYSYFENKGS